MIEKGVISSIGEGGETATAVPSFSDSPVSSTLTVPFYLTGSLKVGMPVVYVQFEDNTGLILARMDGEWNHDLAGDVNIQGNQTIEGNSSVDGSQSVGAGQSVTGSVSVSGSVNASGNVTGGGISLTGHTHTGVHGETSGPH